MTLTEKLIVTAYLIYTSRITNKNNIKTHSSVSVAKKTKEYAWYTSMLFTGFTKLPNSAHCISKTAAAKPISTKFTIKFTYFVSYIYTISHIRIEGNRFSIS